ncbi:hypothetical protein FE257_012985 [Aspergillus nanangensis]|uniref:Copper homeostasis protein cutC homolog n=1 Tax=Aspergillus nanangensis TaxID=2582783 RepID=A0AAD4CFL5_ASPNN|nr:hypothetical protein FE257_012985 [Aspergillus nanangensis]
MSPLLEIACFNAESAILAASAGADRIELCKDYSLGGLTPDPSTLSSLKSHIQIPVYVMIRPTADTFCYDSASFEKMKTEIDKFKDLGADGFVFGILHHSSEGYDEDNSRRSMIDVARNAELVRRAGGRPCTFHRAFDLIPETQWTSALGDISECGFSSLLTNGGPSGTAAVDCIEKLAALVQWTRLHGPSNVSNSAPVLDIIVGGGVRSSNTRLLQGQTRAEAFHSAALMGDDQRVSVDEVRKMRVSLQHG